MLAVTWREFGGPPFAPKPQQAGQTLRTRLENWSLKLRALQRCFAAKCWRLGEYAGLLVHQSHHHDRGDETQRVPSFTSAHGQPASAVMAVGRSLASNATSAAISMSRTSLQKPKSMPKISRADGDHPWTHGVFEASIQQIEITHHFGGQVYLDGANMNAQVGLCRPGDFGADVCHLNLHKTFCIPHGGGGPGVGPIGVGPHLAAYLPGHPVLECGGEQAIGPISAAPYGSASILPISCLHYDDGRGGPAQGNEVAILNANYMASRYVPTTTYCTRVTKVASRTNSLSIVECLKPADIGDDIASDSLIMGSTPRQCRGPWPGR